MAPRGRVTQQFRRQTKQSKQLSLFPIKMITKLELTLSNVQQNIEQFQTPTMGVTMNKSQQQQDHRFSETFQTSFSHHSCLFFQPLEQTSSHSLIVRFRTLVLSLRNQVRILVFQEYRVLKEIRKPLKF